jgi:cell division protein FtsN
MRAGTLVPRSDSAAAAVTGFTIQFAALRSATAAQAVAANIKLSGSAARVVATQRAGVTIYRVVAGPFTTRADAERVAKSSDRSFWIYAGEP